MVGSGLGSSRFCFLDDLAGCKVCCCCCSPDPPATGDCGLGPGGPGGWGLPSVGGVVAGAVVPGCATTAAYDLGSSSLSEVSIGAVGCCGRWGLIVFIGVKWVKMSLKNKKNVDNFQFPFSLLINTLRHCVLLVTSR